MDPTRRANRRSRAYVVAVAQDLFGREAKPRNPVTALNVLEIGLLLSIGAILFSCTILTFPGEKQEVFLTKWDLPKSIITPRGWLFSGPIDRTTRRRKSLFSSTLVLPGLNIYEGLGIDDPEKAKWHDFVFRARGRDLVGAIFDLANLAKVDCTGANLRYASLRQAQLQDASLTEADLRSAFLTGAQLKGAALLGAQLQGASLDGAWLEGASLTKADLQGSSLDGAHLQGASLTYADLQGSSLDGAHLQGASLTYADLQGSSLTRAETQRALFDGAHLQATDLSNAYLWRTHRARPLSSVAALRKSGGEKAWLPEWIDKEEDGRWNLAAYKALQTTIEALPPGGLREMALESIQSLDCTKSDTALASCDSSAPPPPEAMAWRKTLEAASVDDVAYADALAKVLKDLVCSEGDTAIHVVRGFGFQKRLAAAGPAASGLIDDLINQESKDCPVSAALVATDRAGLLQIKQTTEKVGK
jgi:hypothetical protein